MKNQIKAVHLILLILISFKLFEARFIQQDYLNILRFIFTSFCILISIRSFFKFNGGFVLPIQLIFFSIILSIMSSYVSWHQTIIDSIKASVPYLIFVFFFYLLNNKFEIAATEKIIIGLGIIYIILFLFQLLNPQNAYFGFEEELKQDRGITRIVFPGGGVFFLSLFYSLNKITTAKKNTPIWIFYFISCLLITFLQVTRQFIGVVIFMSILHFTRDIRFDKRLIIMFIITFIIIYVYNSDLSLVTGLKKAQNKTLSEGSDYIRVVAGMFFLTDFSPDIITRVFGNGIPYGDFNGYGGYVTGLSQERYFYLTDIGIIGLYAMCGVLSVIGYLIIWKNSFIIKVPPEYFYLKYYLWFLLLTSLTSSTVFHPHYIITTVVVLYIYQRIYENNKVKIKLGRST